MKHTYEQEAYLAHVEPDLRIIEKLLEEELATSLEVLNDVVRHIFFSGGKRLRPLLMVLCARLCGTVTPEVFRGSVIFECLHMASLLHDDLIDEAKTRRGKPAAYTIWGNAGAVLSGDFLLARTITIAAETNDMDVVKCLASLTTEMAQGELQQLVLKGHVDIPKEDYFHIIHRKTALLIETACRVGAMLVHAPVEQIKAVDIYGYHLGMAFQIMDDILDYTADSTTLGKKTGTDLREGKATLPILLVLEQCTLAEKAYLEGLFGQKDVSPADMDRVMELLSQYNALSQSLSYAKEHVAESVAALSIFSSSEMRDTLEAISVFAIRRNV